jgi:DnaK suppressor protein
MSPKREEVLVSKPQAKAAAAGKAPAKAAGPAKPAAKVAAKAPVKAPAKTTAKKAAAAPAKPVTKTAVKSPAPKAQVANAPVARTPGAKTPPPKGAAAKAPAAQPEPRTPAKPPAKVAPAPVAKPTPLSKAAAKPAAAPAPVAPVPAPAPAANRFTDRFAPAVRPVARQMTETAELPKPAQKIDPKLANAWKNKPGRDLTVEELLAMPDSEYMNDKQIEFFRANLQKQKDDLLSNAGETTEHLREDTSIVPDPADRATIEEEHALELRTRDRERKLLKKIAQSLARLDSGDYGFCDETGEPIGLARLLARPTATLSLEAQQRRELKQKMFGD